MLLNSLWASWHLISLRCGISLPSCLHLGIPGSLLLCIFFLPKTLPTFLVPHLYYLPVIIHNNSSVNKSNGNNLFSFRQNGDRSDLHTGAVTFESGKKYTFQYGDGRWWEFFVLIFSIMCFIHTTAILLFGGRWVSTVLERVQVQSLTLYGSACY